jgi:hypothetical protein
MMEVHKYNEFVIDSISNEIAICNDHKKWHYKEVLCRQYAINELICSNVLSIMGYRVPDTRVVRRGNSYFCFSMFIDNNGVVKENYEQNKYWWICSLIPCIWGGFEPVQRVFDNEGRPYFIDFSEVFMYSITKDEIIERFRDLYSKEKNIEYFKDFTNCFLANYERVKCFLLENCVYGFRSNINRILIKLKKSKNILEDIIVMIDSPPRPPGVRR